MSDPFQNVDAAGPEFIKLFADSMDARQSDPTMEAIVADYLGRLAIPKHGRVVEIGAGAGAVTRRIAAHFAEASVVGYEPSNGFVAEAKERGAGFANLEFVCADGANLPCAEATADAVILHTVLSHVTDPKSILNEAKRVLKPGGTLVVCDADFDKSSLASFPNDPLDCLAKEFVRGFVTDAHIVGKLARLFREVGLAPGHHAVTSRLVNTAPLMMPWIDVTTRGMVERGDISPALRDALIAEHDRRLENGTLYGFQLFATSLASKPAE